MKIKENVISNGSCIQIQTLPPTSDSAKYHSRRSYLSGPGMDGTYTYFTYLGDHVPSVGALGKLLPSLLQSFRRCATSSRFLADMLTSLNIWSINLVVCFHAAGRTEQTRLLTSYSGEKLVMCPHRRCLAFRIRTERGGWPVLEWSVSFETKSFHFRFSIFRWPTGASAHLSVSRFQNHTEQ